MKSKSPFESAVSPPANALERVDASRIQAVDREFLLLDEEKKQKGADSYFDLVPSKYKDVVRRLAEDGFKPYKIKYSGSFDEFLSEMSKNWLAKFKAFGSLAEAAGFSKLIHPLTEADRTKANRLAFAMLSQSASYILVGPGAFDTHGEGASSRYVRIPLRQASGISEEVQRGVSLKNIPELGRNVEVIGHLMSSPLISIYTNGRLLDDVDERENTIQILSESVSGTFIEIDHRTFREDNLGPWRRGPKKQ